MKIRREKSPKRTAVKSSEQTAKEKSRIYGDEKPVGTANARKVRAADDKSPSFPFIGFFKTHVNL